MITWTAFRCASDSEVERAMRRDFGAVAQTRCLVIILWVFHQHHVSTLGYLSSYQADAIVPISYKGSHQHHIFALSTDKHPLEFGCEYKGFRDVWTSFTKHAVFLISQVRYHFFCIVGDEPGCHFGDLGV